MDVTRLRYIPQKERATRERLDATASPWPSIDAQFRKTSSANGNGTNFKVSTTQEWSGAKESAGGKIAREIGTVAGIKAVEESKVGTENLDRNEVVHHHLGGGEHVTDTIEQDRDLLIKVVGRYSSIGIDSDTTGEIQGVPDENSIAERQVMTAVGQVDVTAIR